MTKQVSLTQGAYALVDDEDFDLVMKYRWHLIPRRSNHYTAYAATFIKSNGRYTTLEMQRLLLQPEGDLQVDHINGDGLDNRRCNLRICTRSQNLANSRKHKNNTSGYVGVRFENSSWRAVIKCNGTRYHLGMFDTPEEAARAYDKAARELHGQFAALNFS